MATKKASSGWKKPDIASKSAFEALMVDDTGDSSEDEVAPVPATTTATTAATTTPSKKAAARKRAQLRKKGSKLDLGGGSGTGTESESTAPANSIVPPVPSLPKVTQQVNGAVKDTAKQVKETIQPALEAVKPQHPTVNAVKESAKASLPRVLAQEIIETASSSDAETIPDYGDEDDSDIDETSAPAPAPAAAPKPRSPSARAQSPPGSQEVSPSTSSSKPEAYTGADHDPNKKLKAIITRTVWGLTMAGGAIGLVAMGHIYVIILVFVCQAVVYSELTNLFDAGYSGHDAEAAVSQRDLERELRRKGRREERTRWSRRTSWYFFAVTNYFLYGESLIYYFKHILTLQAGYLPSAFSFAQQHRLISFSLYTLGFVSFVASLNRSQLRRQFGLFGWIHMSLLLIVVSSHFIVNNILEGMIWFWVPAALVIINDVAAYVCGMMFGRHQLIKLSPKKTVEGFVGAFFVTIAFAFIWATVFMRYDYMICPVRDLSTNAFSAPTCTPNQVFTFRHLPLPREISVTLRNLTGQNITAIPWAPFQLHAIVLAVFASLVAPFGGFFASGFKRAFNIKDFGDSIPGHGGMTDRMDCQFLMGLFTFVYYASLVRDSQVTTASVLATVVGSLSTAQQLELVQEVAKVLSQKGVKVQHLL